MPGSRPAHHRVGLLTSSLGLAGTLLVLFIALIGVITLFDFGCCVISAKLLATLAKVAASAREAWREDEDALRTLDLWW